MDREDLADFLRRRREALRPDDVGLPEGRRRRTAGLRREEVAQLAAMSTDFYARIEQRRGSPAPTDAHRADTRPPPRPPPPPRRARPPLQPGRLRATAARHPLRPRQPTAAAHPRPHRG